MQLELPIPSLSPSSIMGRPRRVRGTCWTSWIKTLTSVQGLSWGMVSYFWVPVSDVPIKVLAVQFLYNVFLLFCRRELDLKKPIYQGTAAYGHFGRDVFSWELPKKLKYWPPPLISQQALGVLQINLCSSSSSSLLPPPPSSSSHPFLLARTATSPQPLQHKNIPFSHLLDVYTSLKRQQKYFGCQIIQLSSVREMVHSDLSSAAKFYLS